MPRNIFKVAKSISNKHKGLSWQQCIKRAAKQNRQTGTSNKKRDKARKAKAPGKRKSSTGKVYYERRKNRSDKRGHVTGISLPKLRSEMKEQIKLSLGKLLVSRTLAKTKTAAKKIGKRIAPLKRQLNFLTKKH